jgi:hypothetical protein
VEIAVGRVLVNGSLGNATLNFSLNFTPIIGQSLTLIKNDGADAVSGTFNALPEGALMTNGVVVLRIRYAGGDGNDVTLSRVAAAPPSTIQFSGLTTNGLFTLSGLGFSNAPYFIEAATNLNTPILWQTISTNLSSNNGLYQFIDLDSTNFPIRFYRVRSP